MAVTAISEGLRDGGRGQLRSACGTGKTVMAQRAAELLCPPGGIVVVLCPSIHLVVQTLREWALDNQDHTALAVCGDESVEDSFYSAADIDDPVTTDPNRIVAWLRLPTSKGIRLIVGTHMSAHIVGEALLRANKEAELLVVDEAHHAAGLVDKHIGLVHDDKRFPARRRLYGTATPRLMLKKTKTIRGEEFALVGMDDEDVFGPVLFNYPFSGAIEDGWLDDFRVLVVCVTKPEVLRYLQQTPRGAVTDASAVPLQMAAKQVALARATREFDLRRILTFSTRVEEAEQFATTLPVTFASLPAQERPVRPLYCSHVHGAMKSAKRETRLAALADPPHDGMTVISNVRCLGEGMDVPQLDAVALLDKKESIVDILQAIGRVLRRGSGVGTILVPVMLGDHPEEDIDEAVRRGGFDVLWQVLNALRVHDEVFASTLDAARANGYDTSPLPRVLVRLPEGYDTTGEVLRHITVRMIQASTSSWWDGFAALREYHQEHGHCQVPVDYVTPGGYKLGHWTKKTRAAHKQKRLVSERVTALEELGFEFGDARSTWPAGLKAATEFTAKFGHLDVPPTYRAYGITLRAWLASQRSARRRGELSDEKAAALTALGVDFADTHSVERWEDMYERLTRFHARHGYLPSNAENGTPEDRRMARFLIVCRQERKAGRMSAERIAALDSLGMDWDPLHTAWMTGFAAAARYHQRYGHLLMIGDYVDDDGYPLGGWVERQRYLYAQGKLPEHRADALDGLDMVWDLEQAAWNEGLAAATVFFASNGHLRVPSSYRGLDMRGERTFVLSTWLGNRRAEYRAGTLPGNRVNALEQLGIDWNPRDTPWETLHASATAYRDTYGNLNVATEYCDPNGYPLGKQLAQARGQHRNNELAPERVATLTELGIDWDPAQTEWRKSFADAAAYYRKFGNLRPRKDYRIPDRPNLYAWLLRQRNQHAQGTLSRDRFDALNAVGMVWNNGGGSRFRWWEKLEKIRAYYQKNNTLIIPHSYRGEGGFHPYGWLMTQQAKYQAGTLDKDQIAALEDMGIVWGSRSNLHAHWQRVYEEAADYYVHNGHLSPSMDHQTKDGKSLRGWVDHQHARHRDGVMTSDELVKLTQIGFVPRYRPDPAGPPLAASRT